MKALRLLLLAPLAGCAAHAPEASPQACVATKAAEIAISQERGFVSAPAAIDRGDVRLLIDTGAEVSQVTPAAMTSLHLHEDMRRTTTIRGTGGTVTSRNALLDSLGIGGMDQLGFSVAVAPLPADRAVALDASGILGADWLSAFDVELDVPRGRIALYRVHGWGDGYVPWDSPRTTVIARLQGAGLVLLQAQLDGHPITALLDSGANASVITEEAAARAGADAAALARDPASWSSGVDGARLAARRHRFAELRIGEERYAAPVIAVAPLHVRFADMLLGADWLRSNHVWISYATRRVTIQPTFMDRPE